jgi:hypothetical protein
VPFTVFEPFYNSLGLKKNLIVAQMITATKMQMNFVEWRAIDHLPELLIGFASAWK